MQALGMESGAITDSEITASTIFGVYYNSYRGRLHSKESSYAKGGWSSLINDFHQWIRVDLGEIKNVTHIATQGRNGHKPFQYVTSYKLQHSGDGATFLFYREDGQSSDTVSRF